MVGSLNYCGGKWFCSLLWGARFDLFSFICSEQHLTTSKRNKTVSQLICLIVVMAIDFVGSHEVPGSIPWICQKNLVLFVLSSTWPLLIEETPYAFNLLNQCSGKWFGLVLWGSRFNPFARQVFYTEHHFATISFYTESTLLLLIEKTKAHHIYSIISVVSDLICLMSC
jgi:hypothetical protein